MITIASEKLKRTLVFLVSVFLSFVVCHRYVSLSLSAARSVRCRLSSNAGVQAEEPSGGVSWRNRRVSGQTQLRRTGMKYQISNIKYELLVFA